MELTTLSLLLGTCLWVPGGVSAGCSNGEPATWCITPKVQIAGFGAFIQTDTSVSIDHCQTSCETTIVPCRSFSYIQNEQKCSYYTIRGDETTLEESQESDHYWLLCGEGSCPADTTPQDTTTTGTTTTTTDLTTTTTDTTATTTVKPTTTTTTEATTTTTMDTTTTTTTSNTGDVSTTSSTTEDTSTAENPTTTPEQNTTTPVQTTPTSEEPDSWWKLKPVWAAMIGMTVFAVLLIITIFGLLCLMKSRQHVPKSKEFS